MTHNLTAFEYVLAVAIHGDGAWAALVARGHHPGVVRAKATKAARRGLVYGEPAMLTDAGRAFLWRRRIA